MGHFEKFLVFGEHLQQFAKKRLLNLVFWQVAKRFDK